MSDEMKGARNQPATKGDLDDLEKRLTGRFASKDDLKRFATKDDLKRFATKDDLKRFATKDDLHESISGFNARFERIEGNVHRLNLGFAEMKGDIAELTDKVDSLLPLKDTLAQMQSSLDHAMTFFMSTMRKADSQGSMLMEHEARLTKLESRPN